MGKPTRARRRVEPPDAELRRPQHRLDGRRLARWMRRRRLVRWLRRHPLVHAFRRHVPPGRVRAVLGGGAIAAAAFGIGAYVITPYLIQRAIADYGAGAPERSASVERVLVNPFTLTVILVRPELANSSAGASFGADEVRLNFAFPTLLGRSVSLDELAARAPRLRVDLEKMGSEPIFEPATGPFIERLASVLTVHDPVRVGHLRVEGGRLELIAAEAERSSTFGEIQIDAQALATDAPGPSRYSVRSGAVTVGQTTGAALSLEGKLSLPRVHMRGRAKVAGLALGAFRPWFGPRLAAASPGGRLDLEADYEYPVAGDTVSDWRLSNGEARIADAYAEVAPDLVARAPRMVLDLTAARGGEALAAATFGVHAEEIALESSTDGSRGRLAYADSAEATDVDLRTAGAAEGWPWLVTIGTGRLTGLAAAVGIGKPRSTSEAAQASSPPSASGDDRVPVPGRNLLAWLSRPVLAAGDANEAHPIVLHRLELAEGRVAFVDRAATPAARFDVAGLAGSITPAMAPEGGERRNDVVEVSLRGGLPDGGTGSLEVVLDRSVAMSQVAVAEPGPAGAGTAQSSPPKLPAAPSPRGDSIAPSSSADDGVPVPRSVALTLHDVPAVALSPYAERALGRGLSAGRVNLVFDCASAAGQLTGMLQVSGDELVLANASESTPDSPSNEPQLSTPSPNESPVGAASPNESPPSAPPVRLALALLADPAGRVELASVLAPPQTLESAACLPEVAAGTLRSKLAAIAQAPFETLATVIGRDASSLAAVQFEPGAAEPSEAGLVTLDALAEALERRPKLGLTVAGAYDPKVDRAALAVKEVELHVALETAGATLRVTPGPVDFTLPLAQKVLDEFAARLLTPEQRATIASEFDLHAGGAADAATRVAYYRAVFEALPRSQPIQPTALARLGRFRTESIARQLEKRGIGRDRVASADAEGEAIAQNGDVAVPLEAAALPLESAARPLRGGGLLSVQ